MVPDIMHDVLEGSLELCMRHLLIHLIREEKFFSIGTLNARIASINYGPSEVKNKPTEIAAASLTSDYHLKQSGELHVYHTVLSYIMQFCVDARHALIFIIMLMAIQLPRCGV